VAFLLPLQQQQQQQQEQFSGEGKDECIYQEKTTLCHKPERACGSAFGHASLLYHYIPCSAIAKLPKTSFL
jgi:hypothetical protein